jgi:putative ABC transport system permease protein
MIEKNPGFNKENVIAIDASQTDPNNIFPLFKQAILKYPEIAGVTSAAAGLGAGQNFLGFSDQGLSADINIIDPDYIKVMGMKLIAGQNLERPLFKDSISRIIINETMMNSFGWTPQNSLGKEIKNFQGGIAIVEGVVKNFHYLPLSEAIKNQVFETSPDKGYTNIYVRVKAGNPSRAIAAMQKEWNDLLPGIPLKYSFLDDDISNYYGNEQKWSNIVGWAGAISIFLACLGLLGLVSLASINRTKEIGVRKVLGASVSSVITLLSKDFLKLIIVSFAIATPVAYYFMHRWLLDYAYRINIGWQVFAIVGLGTISLALITIGFHAIKAAVANPVKSLRTE